MTDSDKEKERATTCVVNGVDYEGDDIGEVQDSTIKKCEESCQRARDCKYFTYVQSSAKCFLKNGMGTRKVGTDFTSGPAWCPASKTTCYQDTVDFNGDDIKRIGNSNVDQCQEQCQKHPTCKYFTFVKSFRNCHLKSGTGTRKINSVMQ